MASLVIGVGNDLRSDDGAGREVAARVDALGLPGVRVRSLVQLVPELAVDLAEADRAVFVDASTTVTQVTVSEVKAPSSPVGDAGVSHHVTPEALLGLVGAIGGRAPEATYVVAVPVTDLGLGERLSPTTEAAVEEAVALVVELVTGRVVPCRT